MFAWLDGSRLVTKAGEGAPDSYRPLASVLEVVLPGVSGSGQITSIDAAASAAVVTGGAAWLLVSDLEPSPAPHEGTHIGGAKATLLMHARGASVARVREILSKSGAVVTERPRSAGSSVIEFRAKFGGPDGAGDTLDGPRVQLHAAAVTTDGSKGDLCGQIYVDLNALRRSVPDAMDDTVLSRVLGVWGLANARDVMLTCRLVKADDVTTRDPALPVPQGTAPPEAYTGPPMVRVDVTWSARSEEPTKIGRGTLATGFWGLGKDAGVPAGARWVAGVRGDLEMWTLLALRTHAARLDPQARGVFSRSVDRWAATQGESMDRLVRGTRGWVALWPSADGIGLDWRLAPTMALPVDGFGKDAASVLTPFPATAAADASGVRVGVWRGMAVGFAPTGGGVVGRVEFDEGAAEKARGAVGERVKGK